MKKDFVKEFTRLCTRKDRWGAWNDFILCAAVSLSNVLGRDQAVRQSRGQEYWSIMSGMDADERDAMAHMLAALSDDLEQNPEQDFLGSVFMELGLGSSWKGQFFTPYNVCKMMTEMTVAGAEEAIKERGWGSVDDPACGAGATLIAARNSLRAKGFDSGNVLFTAQDISRTAALMCCIQLSLLGCAGYVVIADSLRYPVTGTALDPVFTKEHEVWYTPAWYEDTWQIRRMLARTGREVSTWPAAGCGQRQRTPT